MNAAIYARKSTEQNGVNEEETSVTRQIEHAKVYASKKGWQVSESSIFVDDGISGAEFIKRPGFLRLMNALKPCPVFQILVMSEESRLGRESIETSYALKQIIDAGVRLFFYLEDRERLLESATDKVMLALTNFASEVERERAKQRTYDADLTTVQAPEDRFGRTMVSSTGAIPPEPTGQRGVSQARHSQGFRVAVPVERPGPLCALWRPMEALGKDYQRRKGRVYGCAYHRTWGFDLH